MGGRLLRSHYYRIDLFNLLLVSFMGCLVYDVRWGEEMMPPQSAAAGQPAKPVLAATVFFFLVTFLRYLATLFRYVSGFSSSNGNRAQSDE